MKRAGGKGTTRAGNRPRLRPAEGARRGKGSRRGREKSPPGAGRRAMGPQVMVFPAAGTRGDGSVRDVRGKVDG